MILDVVILTKSSKNKGYCVAGIDINNGQLIRLTSDDKQSHGALFDDDMRYKDGACCEVLDVVKIPTIRKKPAEYQPENVLIDVKKYWKKIDTWSIEDVLRVYPPEIHTPLLGNKYP